MHTGYVLVACTLSLSRSLHLLRTCHASCQHTDCGTSEKAVAANRSTRLTKARSVSLSRSRCPLSTLHSLTHRRLCCALSLRCRQLTLSHFGCLRSLSYALTLAHRHTTRHAHMKGSLALPTLPCTPTRVSVCVRERAPCNFR